MLFIKKPRKLVVLSLLVSVAVALALDLGMRTLPVVTTGADEVATLSSDHGQGQVVEARWWDPRGWIGAAVRAVTTAYYCGKCLWSDGFENCGDPCWNLW
ncbi:MAG: hypothetical protein NTW97_03805 [Candidatus Krumholzibacteria bacterium]|nr:hypothetical protein [Candidatus Krumholzibacteria bacterium]